MTLQVGRTVALVSLISREAAADSLGNPHDRESLPKTSSVKSSDGNDPLLFPEDMYIYRSLVVRAAYFPVDRSDVMFAAKALARSKQKPRQSAVTRVLICDGDADFAGRRVSRKSTSGLYFSRGTSFLRLSSKT
jgi:hypothetical protein